METRDQEIPFSKWPDPLKRLGRIFSQINANLTFILSHSRSTIPTYEYFQKLVPDLTIFDLASIKYFLPPGDVFFDYVDKEDLLANEKVGYTKEQGYNMKQPDTIDKLYEDIKNANENGSSQILLFTFDDMKVDNIGALSNSRRAPWKRTNTESNSFFNHRDLITQKLTQPQLSGIINTRNAKFQAGVSHFVQEVGTNTEELLVLDKLNADVVSFVPSEPDLEDPVQKMTKRQRLENTSVSESLDSQGMVDILKNSSIYKDQIEFEATFTEARPATFKPFDLEMYDIHPALAYGVKKYKGIDMETMLYSHQTEALEHILDYTKTHVITSTSTSSGKSLIYQIPILNSILWDMENGNTNHRASTAIFIFPTKALAQDQKKHLEDLIKHIPMPKNGSIRVDTYDGDTDTKTKGTIRRFANIIFTNPDTIHASILPNHEGMSYSDSSGGWQYFLHALKFIVVDEIHVYKGTFGINVSFVMARLLRVLSHSSSSHQVKFISSSATVLNPESHFRVVCAISPEDNVVHISNDGSACCEKKFLIWNPPPLMNKRVNNITESARVLLSLLGGSKFIKVIVFCPIRQVCELLMKQIRSLLITSEYADLGIKEGDIMAYRGGYSKTDRRNIEQKMFNGEVRALVATNALELGVDLSDLDVVITCSFPVSKSNMHQQFGRAGRGRNAKGSLAIFVAGAIPVDSYYVKHPEELLDKSTYEDLCVESLIGVGMHKLIMENHLQCAAFELPIDIDQDAKWFCNYESTPKKVQIFRTACAEKLNQDKLHRYRTSPDYLPWPASKVAIRAVESPAYAVVDITNGRNIVIEEVEESRTSFTLYEGGIFLHQGLPYLVKDFNSDKKYAKVQRVTVDWVTSQRDFTDVDPHIIEYIRCLKSPMREVSDIPAYFGTIEITTIVFGFFKVNKKNEIIEAVEVKNPPVRYKSKGFWLDIPKPVLDAIVEKSLSPAGGIHAAQHCLMNILPLYISGSATELLTECKAPEKEFARRQTKRKRPARLIFYDSKGGPSGSGVSAKAFEYIDEILLAAYDRVKDCDCEWGCPKCVTASFCKEGMTVMSKPAAYIILGSLVGRELSELVQEVPDGPELNMPEISVETVQPASSVVKMAKDVEIVEIKRATKPLKPIKKE
ncbi:P-loop containing nucleoside triphosphate hydrolase protein [Yamadazyma tenuis ATCC 10573]|uniref:p-loop containing nucleoside triphosphate hydrolase protein n=1 Tax=Candida tenuis (strain ATCC 10573 / BCRC 21748 / CBS 615 / JCM 9827 / NBRC 10315 / NRRL Y-1498 / VKM Y-70) TaxID=590646 RepID=G3BE68_CANTC|nr:P-loop containing nucleoside triphosphate hydrolase protein [Yamadazyma tenuis ATCC 10573]EGV60472.1 P-loop containing nucleoside triphosphate hydrolase protein [Yamadazyma tenuis ATCC 10573]